MFIALPVIREKEVPEKGLLVTLNLWFPASSVCVFISGILARLSAWANYVFVMSNYGRLKD